MGGGGVGENLVLRILYIKLLGLLLGTWLSFSVFSIKFHVVLVSKEEGEAHGMEGAWGIWIVAIPLWQSQTSSCMSAKCLSFFSFKLPVHFQYSL